jgi:hypothetical protein
MSFAGPAAATAQHYRAEPVTAVDAQRLVIRDTVFRCGASGCTAARSADRPERVCAALVREVGALASFSVGGRVLDAAALAECNRRAR